MFNIYLFKKIISTKWKFGTVILHLTTLISFSIIAYHNLDHGYIMSPDSFNYSIYADELIKLKFNLYDFSSLSTVVNHNSHYTVTVPVILIALSKIIFENSWQYAFILFNLILVFFSLIVAAFHSFTYLDYDWRFRYPLVLPLIMIFSISVEAFLRNNNVK